SPAELSFVLTYRYRPERRDTWNITSPWGVFPADRDGLEMFARFGGQSVKDYAAANGIDLTKPDLPAQEGYGSPMYIELTDPESGDLLDAYTLGESEDLFDFYGKITVRLTVPHNVKTLQITGRLGADYEGDTRYGEAALTPLGALPDDYIAPKPNPREALRRRLIEVADSTAILYGVQNFPYEKGGYIKGTSDVYDLVGRQPAVFGLDSLSLIGMEGASRGSEREAKAAAPSYDARECVRRSAELTISLWRQGVIPTLSCHMSDPAMVYDHFTDGKTELKLPDGGWSFYGYGYDNSCKAAIDPADGRARSPHKPMLRLCNGEAGVTEVFNAYLDIIAEYCLLLQNAGVPLLLRPFHENSGDWFWWGNSGCETAEGAYDPAMFHKVWRYWHDYFDRRGVTNCLWVYSPNGPDFDDTSKLGTEAYRPYIATYPGDDYVDVCAFDDYTTDKAVLEADVAYITKFAAGHGKIAAASEVTGSPTDPAITELEFSTLTGTRLSYMLQWTPPSFAPFLVSPTRANSAAARTFINWLNSKDVLLAQ
ncbi:MAG: glycoside hydrolase family 26 protein, partial [Oscillospiraceae bacterium]|nr:glycoside hydrolase family 26 protein [Oscillospiraceae bacterium]